MADPADIAAIEGAGGIPSGDFPGFENHLDIYLNHFARYNLGFDIDLVALSDPNVLAPNSLVALADVQLEMTSEVALVAVASGGDAEVIIGIESSIDLDPIASGLEGLLVGEFVQEDIESIAQARAFSVIESGVLLEDTTASGLIGVRTDVESTVTLSSLISSGKIYNPRFREDGIVDFPVWVFEPNWTERVTETLEWLTDVMVSPSGAEQRRALRLWPRRTFEYQVTVKGPERAYLDNFIMTHGASDMFLPLWHDAHILSGPSINNFLPCEGAQLGEMRIGDIVFIHEGVSFEYDLAQVADVWSSGIVLTRAPTRVWNKDAIVHTVKRARLTEQPRLRRETSDLSTATVRFRTIDSNVFWPALPAISYGGIPVLTEPPDEIEQMDYGYERMIEELDNQTALPTRYDSAGIAFPNQVYRWQFRGMYEHNVFRSLVYALRGRQAPIWMPTFLDDFEMIGAVVAGQNTLTVKRCGFTELGGPREGRQDIMISPIGTPPIFKRVIAATLNGPDSELLLVDTPFANGFAAHNIEQICFLTVSRLNQDVIEIVHATDSAGIASSAATFRSAPPFRIPLPAI